MMKPRRRCASSSERRTDRKAAAFLARSVPCCAPTVPGRSGAGVHRSIARRPRICSEELPGREGQDGRQVAADRGSTHPTAWCRAARTPPRPVVPPALVGQYRLEHRQRDHDRGRQPAGRDHDHRSDRHRRGVRGLRHPDPGLRARRRERHRPDRPPAPADHHGRGSPRHRPGGRAAPRGWGRWARPLLPRVGGRRGRHAPLRRDRECGRGRGDAVRPPGPGERARCTPRRTRCATSSASRSGPCSSRRRCRCRSSSTRGRSRSRRWWSHRFDSRVPGRGWSPRHRARSRPRIRPASASVSPTSRGHRVLRRLVGLWSAQALWFGATFAILVYYALHALDLTAAGYGLLGAASGAGMLAGNLGAGPVIGTRDRGYAVVLLLVTATAALGYLIVAVAGGIVVAAAGLFVWGAGIATGNVAVSTLRQRLIPVELYGRVFTVATVLNRTAVVIGALLGGVAALVGGARLPWFLAAGVQAVLLVAVAALLRDGAITAAITAAEAPVDPGRLSLPVELAQPANRSGSERRRRSRLASHIWGRKCFRYMALPPTTSASRISVPPTASHSRWYRAACSSVIASMVACSSESLSDDRAVVLHEDDALVAERVDHRQVRLHAVVEVGGLVVVEQHRRDVVHADRPTLDRRQHRDVVRVQVDDRVHVGTRLGRCGRGSSPRARTRARPDARLRSKSSLRDAVGRGLVEVLEAGDPERVVLVVGAGADVAADVASRSPRGTGCAGPRRCGTGCPCRVHRLDRSASVSTRRGRPAPRRAPGAGTAATRSPT